MLRLVGGIMTATVSAWYGFAMAASLRRRRDFLTAVSGALGFISAEIKFGRYRIGEIFVKIDNSPALCGFFATVSEHMAADGLKRAWCCGVDTVSERAGLKADDGNALKSLGNELGFSDVGGQSDAIARTLTLIDGGISNAREEYERLSRVYRGCGILLGVFFLIIVI